MKNIEQGFSAVEAFLVVVIVVLMGGVGYSVYHREHKSTPTATISTTSSTTQATSNTPSSSSTQSVPAAGTTALINYITSQDVSSETSIDAQYTTNDQSAVQNSNAAASNLGGAYNESNL